MNNELVITHSMQDVSLVVNQYATNNAFADYISHKATNIIKVQRFDLTVFTDRG